MSAPWVYIGGVGLDEIVRCLSGLLGDVPQRKDLLENIEPGITVWTWTTDGATVRLESLFARPGDWFEVEAAGDFPGRGHDAWSNLQLGIWIVDHCPHAFALVDDAQHCSSGGSDFVRVTRSRLEVVRFVDDSQTGIERIDESLTTLIALRGRRR